MAVTIKNLPDGRKIKVNSFGSRRSEPTSFVEATIHEETGQPIALSNVDNVKYYKQIIGGTEKVLQKSSI
ncbi:MAG: hypothetical protein INR69_21600, partial [Mucilaginibacter polytrichastri]|nr:hypothetical protein [Mucilaginibacter polytrichastri]